MSSSRKATPALSATASCSNSLWSDEDEPFGPDGDAGVAGSGGETLPSVAELLELSGEDSLSSVREIVLRGRGMTDGSLNPVLSPLVSLEVLSLSNNSLTSLSSLPRLGALHTLNVNFNRLSSLEPLAACTGLTKLFAASNRIASLAPLSTLTGLRALSVYRNRVGSLDAAVEVLGGLGLLEELDLGANPCALDAAYKHWLVTAVPSLAILDGDTLTDVERDMASAWAAEQEEAVAKLGELGGADDDSSGLPVRQPLRVGGDVRDQARAEVHRCGGGGAGGAEVLTLDADDHGGGRNGRNGQGGPSVVDAFNGDAIRPQYAPAYDDDTDDEDEEGAHAARVAAAMAQAADAAEAAEDAVATRRPAADALRPGTGMGGARQPTGATRPGTGIVRPGTSLRPGTGLSRIGTASGIRPGTGAARPGTSATRPATGAARPGTSADGSVVGDDRPSTASVRPAAIFRDPFLNNNPILLEYLSQAELEKRREDIGGGTVGQVEGAPSAAALNSRPGSSSGVGRPGTASGFGGGNSSTGAGASAPLDEAGGSLELPDGTTAGVVSLRRPLVERLRMTAAAMESMAHADINDLAASNLFDGGGADADGAPSGLAPSAYGGSLRGAAEAAAELRDLILAVQDLTAERDEARTSLAAMQERLAVGKEAEELTRLREENAKLRAENANMFMLMEENEHLRTETATLRLRLECAEEASGSTAPPAVE